MRSYAREKVAAFDSFTKGFMPGMIIENWAADFRPRVLVSDEETTLALKKIIGAFVGMPMTGKEAGILRKAAENLTWLSLSALRHSYY